MRVSALFALLSISLISLNACAAKPVLPSAGLIQAELGSQPVQLSDGQGRCVLTREGSEPFALDMQWPCRFSEDQQHKARVESFRQALIIMVERSEPEPAPSNDCKTDLQAVRLFKGKLEASPVSRVSACGPGYWDQKTYTWLFDW